MVMGAGGDNGPILTYFVPTVAVWCIDVHFEAHVYKYYSRRVEGVENNIFCKITYVCIRGTENMQFLLLPRDINL